MADEYYSDVNYNETFGADAGQNGQTGEALPVTAITGGEGNAIASVISAATQAIAPDYTAYQGTYGGAENQYEAITSGNGGVASSLGNNWLTETFGKAFSWYEGQKDQTKAAVTTLGFSMLKGVFGYADEKRKARSNEKLADAAMMRAQNEVDMTNRKFENASAIGKTNFGKQPTGLLFSNKLATRQARAGYGG